MQGITYYDEDIKPETVHFHQTAELNKFYQELKTNEFHVTKLKMFTKIYFLRKKLET